MDFRTTKDGLLVASFKLLGDQPIKLGTLQKVGSSKPKAGMHFAVASITIDGASYIVLDLMIHKSKIVIWKFPNEHALLTHDMASATIVNGVYEWLDLRLQSEAATADGGNIGYHDPIRDCWLDFETAGKMLF